jgi:hypothetical protein
VKVRFEITLDVDAEAWTLNYGIEGAREIRQDVVVHAANTLLAQFENQGLLTKP